MRKIQMVDLHSQYLKIKDEIDREMQDVLDSSAFIGGPVVREFSFELEKLLGVMHVIPCANGTDALQIALMALGLKPGDEVITSDFTFAATVEVIGLLGLKPVLVDVDPNTFNMIPSAFERAITKKTKAVIPVHLFGQCSDMDEIMSIALRNGIYVVEDTAQAIGAQYFSSNRSKPYAGTIGHIGTTSFFPSKNLGCYGDGGALFTNDDRFAERARVITNHGMKVRYYHDEIGVNSRLDSLQAAVLKVKLKKLGQYTTARQEAANFYNEHLAGAPHIKTPERSIKSGHVYHQYTLKTVGIDRFAFQAYLAENEIPAMVYYPVPLHKQKAYTNSSYRDEDFPNTMMLCESVISLPMHTELDQEQLEYIVDVVLAYKK